MHFRCRHEAIAEYFNDPRPLCGNSCDFCKNPKVVKEAARNMKLCQMGKGPSVGSMTANFERGQPDYRLYGGGRWGYKG